MLSGHRHISYFLIAGAKASKGPYGPTDGSVRVTSAQCLKNACTYRNRSTELHDMRAGPVLTRAILWKRLRAERRVWALLYDSSEGSESQREEREVNFTWSGALVEVIRMIREQTRCSRG